MSATVHIHTQIRTLPRPFLRASPAPDSTPVNPASDISLASELDLASSATGYTLGLIAHHRCSQDLLWGGGHFLLDQKCDDLFLVITLSYMIV